VGTGFSSVTLSQHRLYTIGNDNNVDTVYCLNADTGKEIWSHSYASATDPNEFEGGPTSTPTIDQGKVFTLGRSGDLFAFDKATGEIRWSKNIATETGVRVPAWGFAASPLVHGQMLILNIGDAGTAVEKETGTVIWSSADKDSGYSSPVPFQHKGHDGVILGSARSYVCVDAASGEELWRQRWLTTFGCNAADPITDGNHVFLSSGYNRGSALLDLSSDSPIVVWKHKDFQNQLSSSVLIDGQIYGVSGDVAAGAKLTCIDMMTGEVRWRNDELRIGSLSAAGQRLIVISDSGELIIVQATPRECRVLARHPLLDGKCWTAPVLSGGRIYVRSAEGDVVCADVRQ
jgi:outer membrane protein assembly factor BamB